MCASFVLPGLAWPSTPSVPTSFWSPVLRVNDVLDVVMDSDVIPALVGLDMEGHLSDRAVASQERSGHNTYR